MGEAVLVTGGSGFIGSHIARQLAARGDQVLIFDQRPPADEAAWWLDRYRAQITYVQGSIDQWPEVMAAVQTHKPAAIVHTAAIGNPAAVQYKPFLALQVNVVGSLNVLEAARIHALRRVVLFSSIGALPGIRYQPVDCSHPVICSDEGPGSGFYGASKISVEAFAFGYQSAFGTDFIVLRPSAVYGFGMQHPIFIKPMVEQSLQALPVAFEQGRDFPRDYTHVEDVAQLTLRALDVAPDKVRDRLFYAATGHPLRTAGEVAAIVSSQVPGARISVGAGLSAADQLEIRYRGVLSIENAREQLGYEPRYARLEDGVQDYIQTCRRYLNKEAAA